MLNYRADIYLGVRRNGLFYEKSNRNFHHFRSFSRYYFRRYCEYISCNQIHFLQLFIVFLNFIFSIFVYFLYCIILILPSLFYLCLCSCRLHTMPHCCNMVSLSGFYLVLLRHLLQQTAYRRRYQDQLTSPRGCQHFNPRYHRL